MSTNVWDDYNNGNVSGAVALDLNKGKVQEFTLTGNATSITLSNGKKGQTYTFVINQDATGSRTISWSGSSFKFKQKQSGPTLTTAANSQDIQRLFYDGSVYNDIGFIDDVG